MLNGKKVIPPLHTPISVRYADGELEKLEHKLFIGLVPRTVTQEQLYDAFKKYGNLIECQLVTPKDPITRACAFIRYEKRSEAVSAIKGIGEVIFQNLYFFVIINFIICSLILGMLL